MDTLFWMGLGIGLGVGFGAACVWLIIMRIMERP